MTTIALTGVTGAMGGEVLYSLMHSEREYFVRCIVFEKEKKIPSFVKKLLKEFKDRIFWFRGNIANADDVATLLDGADYCLHCAALIPPKSDHDSKGVYLSNFVGTKNIVDRLKELKEGGKEIPLVHVATVALYGNRTYPHVWGRVGDPIISSDYDTYSLYKLKAERYVLESGLKFVSLRQTAVAHKYMFANNLSDGLMFHTSWNCPLEWVTDVDSGVLCKNLVEADEDGKLNGFWNKIYNIGGGSSCRVTGYDTLNDGFEMMGLKTKKIFKPNYNVARNFHGVWFYDSDILENYLHFRSESVSDFWARMGKKYRIYKLAKIVPSALISKLVIQRLFKNTNSPRYWVEHGKEGRIKAFFGGREKYEAIGEDWDKYNLLRDGKLPDGSKVNYEALKDVEKAKSSGLLLNHGWDDEKDDSEVELSDLKSAAQFRGGECLEESFEKGDVFRKLKWRCHEGHEFTASAFTVLRGGYFCPHCCEPKPWAYGKVARVAPFWGQVYFDTHDESETDDVYPLSDDEDDFMENK